MSHGIDIPYGIMMVMCIIESFPYFAVTRKNTLSLTAPIYSNEKQSSIHLLYKIALYHVNNRPLEYFV